VLEEYEAAIAALAELPKNPPDAEALLAAWQRLA